MPPGARKPLDTLALREPPNRAPRNPRNFGAVKAYESYERGMGTMPRWFDRTWPNEALTPGPCTTYPTLVTNTGQTATGHIAGNRRFGTGPIQKRFLQNEAITISLLGLTDPFNPGPGDYNVPRPFGVPRRGPPGPQRRRPPLRLGGPGDGRLPKLAKRPITTPMPGGAAREPEIAVAPANREMLQRMTR